MPGNLCVDCQRGRSNRRRYNGAGGGFADLGRFAEVGSIGTALIISHQDSRAISGHLPRLSVLSIVPSASSSTTCNLNSFATLKYNVDHEQRKPRIASLGLYRLPEVIRIKELRELRIDIHHMHISLLCVSNDGFVVVTCLVRLDVDTKRSVYLELQSITR
jgi:hypothetical protein